MDPFGTDSSKLEPGRPNDATDAISPERQSDCDDYKRAIEYLYERINYEKTADSVPYPFRLRRMNELLDRLELHGVAGQSVPVVHIAGTKGKGSTSSMIASMLTAGGYRTGLYTSPHLIRLEERFTVDGIMPNEANVVSIIEAIAVEADRMAKLSVGAPTFFEMTTAMALLHFRRAGCNAVVLEVGLGGKLDSTNVCYPAVTAITSIGFDHQHILGNTLAEIASQKAGIIKHQIPVVSGVLQDEARQVIQNTAAANDAPLWEINRDFQCEAKPVTVPGNWGTIFSMKSQSAPIRDRSDWTTPLDGEHQGRNATVACAVADLLDERGHRLPLESQKSGLEQLRVAGRVERFAIRPGVDVILDTAHNTDSIQALCKCIRERAAGRPVTIIFGTSRDKEHRPMLTQLCRETQSLILTRYHGNPRYRDTADLLRDLPNGETATVIEFPEEALRHAMERVEGPHLVVICGSFFLAAELRPLLMQLT